MPGRRGPGRGPAPVRRAVRVNHAKKAARAADENQKKAAETKEESPPKKEEETPKTKVVSYECEYPRCEKPPEYGFKDKASYAQFCVDHKSDDVSNTN